MSKEKEQLSLSDRVVLEDLFESSEKLGGVASSYFSNRVVSGTIIYEYGQILEEKYAVEKIAFPYRPAFLMFTEGTSSVNAIKKLSCKPDLIFVNGHGIAHPRKAGLACYIGVLTGIPTIGVSKESLVGEYKEPKYEKKAEKLVLNEQQVGWVLKPRATISPIFVSPGNGISLKSCLDITKKFIKNRKLPEPLELARDYSKKVKEHVEQEIKRKEEKERLY